MNPVSTSLTAVATPSSPSRALANSVPITSACTAFAEIPAIESMYAVTRASVVLIDWIVICVI